MSSGTVLLIALVAATVAYLTQAFGGRQAWGLIGTAATIIALGTLSVGLVTRGVHAAHWPLANQFEFALCWLWAALVFYLLMENEMGTRSGGAFLLPLLLALALWAASRPETAQAIRPSTPALRTGWFPLHAGCSAIAYGAFTVAGGLGLMYLAVDWARKREHYVSFESRFSSPERIEYFIWRAVGLGFPWLTLGMVTGAIWAQVAWGRYWDWDPKESWTLIMWLTYLILFHGRTKKGWRGRRIAWMAIIGLGVVAFTFVGVGWLVSTMRLESVHIF